MSLKNCLVIQFSGILINNTMGDWKDSPSKIHYKKVHKDQVEQQEWLSEANENLCVLLIYIYKQNSTFKRKETLPILLLSHSVFCVTGKLKYELKHSKLISQHITALLRFWTSPNIHTLSYSTPWLIKKFSNLKSITLTWSSK
jgi:hypothetical protein